MCNKDKKNLESILHDFTEPDSTNKSLYLLFERLVKQFASIEKKRIATQI